MKIPTRQHQVLQALPLQADKETAATLGVSRSHLCGTLTILLKRGLIVSLRQERTDYGKLCRWWTLTSKGENVRLKIGEEEEA